MKKKKDNDDKNTGRFTSSDVVIIKSKQDKGKTQGQ